MTDLRGKLSDTELSSVELTDLQDFTPQFIEDYLSMKDDIQAIANHIAPPPGAPAPPAILRDDLLGDGDVSTAPTSNQAYILDQKTIANTQTLSDHLSDEKNPHAVELLDLIDILTNSYTGLAGGVPVVNPGERDAIIRRLFALDILFDDSNLGTGDSNLQQLIETLDDQIGLRETAATGIIDGGGGTIVTPTAVGINAGNGEIVDGYTDRRAPNRTNVSWDAIPSFTINMPSILGVQVIFTDATGVVQQQAMPLSESQRRTIVQISFVYYRNGAIISLQHAGIHSNEIGNTLYDMLYRMSFAFRSSGMGIRPVNNALSVFADAGDFLTPGINVANDLKNPNIGIFPAVGDVNTPMTFDVLFADSTVVPGLANQTTIPKFYESAPGVSTALSGNDATIGYLHKTFGNTYLYQLGTKLYTNGALARDSLETDRDQHIEFLGSENTLPSAQIYNDRTSSDFDDSTKAGIVSLIGSGAGSSGNVAVSNWVQLADTIPTSYIGRARQYSRVDPGELGIDLVQLEIIDDSSPTLGGDLKTNGNNLIIESGTAAEVGQVGNTATGGAFLAKTSLGSYDPNDGGIAAEAGVIELHGGVAQVKTLAGVDNREVWVNKDGSLFSVEPPPPGFSVIDTDNGVYLIPTLGIFVQMTGLQVTIPQAVVAGTPLKLIINAHVKNGSATRGGSINLAFGINGAAPTGNGVNKIISGSLNSVVPVSITTTSHGGLAINDTVEVWVRRSTQDHNQFDPQIDASTGGLHEMAVSNEASSGGISLATAEALHRIQTRTVAGSTSLLLADERNKIDYDSASAGNITIDPVSTTAYPAGYQSLVKQKGLGPFTLVEGAGVTIDAEDGLFTSAKQNTVISLIYDGSDNWTASGNFV